MQVKEKKQAGKGHLTEWQKRELEKRRADYKAGKAIMHDWPTVHKEITETLESIRRK